MSLSFLSPLCHLNRWWNYTPARGKAVGREVDLFQTGGSLKEARISSTNLKETQFLHARGELDFRRLTQRKWVRSMVVLDRWPPGVFSLGWWMSDGEWWIERDEIEGDDDDLGLVMNGDGG
ncbi:hypothetical protein LWI28_011763 [Acer negundo]|uniref:Uncharacterized protein n=1 Tax=Acer negundo TaxID=4023 RepID=A0AAD5NLL5_ACENE|nr:hypothetical protein LWI28_011763 [Acer negundo]